MGKIYDKKEEKQQWFSVKSPRSISGKIYRPSICYEVTSLIRPELEKLAKKRLVTFYDAKVGFVNGVAQVKKV